MIVRVGVTFAVDADVSPPWAPIHDALQALRAVEVEATSVEAGEHYADLIRKALEREGS